MLCVPLAESQVFLFVLISEIVIEKHIPDDELINWLMIRFFVSKCHIGRQVGNAISCPPFIICEWTYFTKG